LKSANSNVDSNVTVIIPALNEEENIREVIQELSQMGYSDILVVDGNSTDRTVEIARELAVNVVIQNEIGKGAALRQAFDHDGLNGSVIVVMDADGSMNPREIPLFTEALDKGADLVKGSRFLTPGRSEDMNLIRRIGNGFFLLLVNLIWSANYTDLCYGFAAFTRDAIDRLSPYLKSTSFEIETEVFIKARKLGLRVIEVPSVEFRRKQGKSNLSIFRDGFRILRTIFREFIDGRRIRNRTTSK